MACDFALFRSRTCYRCAFICSFSKFSGHRKSHASSNKATLHAWLFLAYNLSTISLSHLQPLLPLPPTTHCPPRFSAWFLSPAPIRLNFFVRRHCRSFPRVWNGLYWYVLLGPRTDTMYSVTRDVGGRYGSIVSTIVL